MNSLTDQAAKVLAEIDEQLAICEKATAGPRTNTTTRYQQPGYPFAIIHYTPYDQFNAVISAHIRTDADATFIVSARTVCPKSLRCLKMAIEQCLDKKSWDGSIHQMYIRQDAEEILAEIITQWNENK